ncbi:MAG: hypothetical protein ACFFD4_29745, partial [Candidatus Odinarchaeota archaeon]
MKEFETLFDIGYKVGALSRQVEMVIEASSKRSSERLHIMVYRVYENLKYILNELKELGISEKVQEDLLIYLSQLTGGKIIENSEQDEEESTTMVIGTIKRKIKDRKQNLNRKLKIDEVRELDLKLKLWKDK